MVVILGSGGLRTDAGETFHLHTCTWGIWNTLGKTKLAHWPNTGMHQMRATDFITVRDGDTGVMQGPRRLKQTELLLGTGNALTLLDFRIKNVGPFSESSPQSSPTGPHPTLRTQCSPMSGGTFGALVPIISLSRGHNFARSGGHRLRLTDPLTNCLP